MKQNKLILGTVQMGLNYGINNTLGKMDKAESFNILNLANQCGISTLDTAEAYGDAHKIIGEFHRHSPTKKFQVITKLSKEANSKNLSYKIDQFLNDLAVEEIEVLMFHSFESYKSRKDILPLLKKLKNEGKFKFLGVSIYSNLEAEDLIKDDDIQFIQLPFNLLDNNSKRNNIIRKAKENGKTIHTRSAFLQGLFFKDPADISNVIVQKLSPQLKKINAIKAEYNIDIQSLAINYCLQQKFVDNVIIGVDSVKHLHSNLLASKYVVSDHVIRIIDEIETQDDRLLNPSLWKSLEIQEYEN